MNRVPSRLELNRAARRATACGIVLCAAVGALAQAQSVYRIVGPDGKVTFSDQPPPAAAKAAAPVATAASNDSAAASGARLPLELRKVASQFPVVLYTGKDCVPCNSGRNMLTNRGIPFTEKTVDNAESAAALKQLSGQSSIPLLTIGAPAAQRLFRHHLEPVPQRGRLSQRIRTAPWLPQSWRFTFG